MSPQPGQTITKHFATRPDPRTGNAQQHLLLDMLAIAICAVICGADGWTEVAAWGVAKEAWLRQFLVLPNGIPSHDTFGRVFARLDPQADGCQEEHFRQVPRDYAKQIKGHGRLEIRECWTLFDHAYLDYLRDQWAWKNLQTLVQVRAERRIGTHRSVETRYYISSLKDRAKFLLRVVRGHWDIENGLHWVLDIAFREDESRIRKDHGPENFAILRHIALNLLKQEQTAKIGVHGKRLKAGWDENYLLLVLSG